MNGQANQNPPLERLALLFGKCSLLWIGTSRTLEHRQGYRSKKRLETEIVELEPNFELIHPIVIVLWASIGHFRIIERLCQHASPVTSPFWGRYNQFWSCYNIKIHCSDNPTCTSSGEKHQLSKTSNILRIGHVTAEICRLYQKVFLSPFFQIFINTCPT